MTSRFLWRPISFNRRASGPRVSGHAQPVGLGVKRESPLIRNGFASVENWLSAILVVTSALALMPAFAAQPGSRVTVDAERHDFGKADVDATGRHSFIFTNTGNEPLVLTRGRSTCGCCTCVCTVRLPDGAIAPREAAKVTLEWKSKLYVGSFRQTATILTNDPDRREVKLLISGRFTGPVGVVPSQLSFSSVRMGHAATAEARLYNYLDEALEVTSYELSNPQNAKYFDVAWEPLTAEQLRKEGEARGGYLTRIDVKPGLPAGAFHQTIVFKTKSKSVPTVKVPIQGLVVSDVSVAGRGWNAQTGVLAMGTVKSCEGTKWPLVIVIRGPHAKDVDLTPTRIVPDSLRVELGSTRHIAEKAISLTRVTIRIPPGSQPSTHLGAQQGEPGRITLQTKHPEVPELNIRVRFAVIE